MDVLSISFVSVFAVLALIPAVWSVVGLATGRGAYIWGVLGGAWAILWLIAFFIAMGADWGGCRAAGESGVVWCGEACVPAEWQAACRGPTEEACVAGTVAPASCPPGVAPVYAYCEAIQEGLVRQPWSTWSDLAFIASGLWILWWLGFGAPDERMARMPGKLGRSENPMRRATPLAVAYGLIVIFMGPASMLLHASMKSWAGWFDAFSVYTWLFFCMAYLLFAPWGWGRGLRMGLVLGLWGVCFLGFGIWSGIDASARFYGIVISGVLVVVAEAVHAIGVFMAGRIGRNWWWFALTYAVLVATMVTWGVFNPEIAGANVCRDVQSFPGHALFHLLAALATFLLFVTFRSERPVPARK